MQIFCRFYDNARKAIRRIGNVVALERLQFPASRLLVGQNLGGRGVDFVEVSRADKLLQHRDVRIVRRVQRKAFRIGLEQAGIGGMGVLRHRRIRL